MFGEQAEDLLGEASVSGAATHEELTDVCRQRRAEQLGEHPGDGPSRADRGERDAASDARRLQGVTAPFATTLTGPSKPPSSARANAAAASCSCSNENGRSDSAPTGTTGSRSNLPNGLAMWGPTIGAHRIAVTVAPATSPISRAAFSTSSNERPNGDVGLGAMASSGRVGAPRPRP